MLYQYTITVPPNTPPENPITKKIVIDNDVIYSISITIPPGHMGLTGIRLLYGQEPILPVRTLELSEGKYSLKEEWITGDAEVITDYTLLEVYEKPFPITIQAFNRDAYFKHSFVVRIVALDTEKVFWFRNLNKYFKGILQFLGLERA